jgi:hypothetical protein
MFFTIKDHYNKMKLPKTSTLVAIGAVALGLATAGIGVTYAAAGSNAGNNPVSNLVSAISQKFNLNPNDVQQVFDQQHQQMQAQHEQAFKDRLAQTVKDGKLTQEQSDKITAKMDELKAQREADKDSFSALSPQDRKAKIQEQITALKQWQTDNNIPDGFLPVGPGGHGMDRGMGMGGGQGHHQIMGVNGDSDGPQDDGPGQADNDLQ